MRNLLRAGVSGVILLLMMLGAGLVLWIGVPVAWLYIGSRVQGSTHSLGTALAVMMVGVVVSILLIVPVLGWLNRKHLELREERGLVWLGATGIEAGMYV